MHNAYSWATNEVVSNYKRFTRITPEISGGTTADKRAIQAGFNMQLKLPIAGKDIADHEDIYEALARE